VDDRALLEWNPFYFASACLFYQSMITQLELILSNIAICPLLSPGKLPGASILSGFSWPTWTHRYNTRTGGNDIKLLIFVVEADKKWAGVLVPGKFFRQIYNVLS
jgi:hypothetical protein